MQVKAAAETLLSDKQSILLKKWLRAAGASVRSDVVAKEISRADLEGLHAGLLDAVHHSGLTVDESDPWAELRLEVERFARARARAGAPVTDSSTMLLVLKDVLHERLGEDRDPHRVEAEVALGKVIDTMVLWLVEVRAGRLDQIIERQREEMRELSTPVIELWRGVLALPLVGTLDSARAELVMESLLEGIAKYDAKVAILDITGVPTVDGMIAQRLLKTVAAARLMGSECIISGIGPRIAHTMVQLGVDVGNVQTTSRLSDALAIAFSRLGVTVSSGHA